MAFYKHLFYKGVSNKNGTSFEEKKDVGSWETHATLETLSQNFFFFLWKIAK
jgi:hypothetical protein